MWHAGCRLPQLQVHCMDVHPHAVTLPHGILAALAPQSPMVTAGCGGRWCTAASCPPRLGAGTLHGCAMAATAICCPARLSALLLHATALAQGACSRPAACHSRLWRPFVRCGILPSPPSCWYAAWMCEGRSGPVSPCSVASALAARHHSHVRLQMVQKCSSPLAGVQTGLHRRKHLQWLPQRSSLP